MNFILDSLQSGLLYRIIIFAVNIKGRSEPVIIDEVQVRDAAKLTGKLLNLCTFFNFNFKLSAITYNCFQLFNRKSFILKLVIENVYFNLYNSFHSTIFDV